MNMKDYRKMIYGFVEKNFGEIKPDIQGKFSDLLHEFMQYANSVHEDEKKALKSKVDELRKILRNRPTKIIYKKNPVVKSSQIIQTNNQNKNRTYFNYDFLNKG